MSDLEQEVIEEDTCELCGASPIGVKCNNGGCDV